MSIAADDQRRQSLRWRALVALFLRSEGVHAEARPASRGRGDAFNVSPDVAVDGWHIVASPVGWSKASAYLTRAVHATDEAGAGAVPVLCLPRQQHEPGDSYAILRLSDLARLMKAQKGAQARSEPVEADS